MKCTFHTRREESKIHFQQEIHSSSLNIHICQLIKEILFLGAVILGMLLWVQFMVMERSQHSKYCYRNHPDWFGQFRILYNGRSDTTMPSTKLVGYLYCGPASLFLNTLQSTKATGKVAPRKHPPIGDNFK